LHPVWEEELEEFFSHLQIDSGVLVGKIFLAIQTNQVWEVKLQPSFPR
jgi:hypothetical protein